MLNSRGSVQVCATSGWFALCINQSVNQQSNLARKKKKAILGAVAARGEGALLVTMQKNELFCYLQQYANLIYPRKNTIKFQIWSSSPHSALSRFPRPVPWPPYTATANANTWLTWKSCCLRRWRCSSATATAPEKSPLPNAHDTFGEGSQPPTSGEGREHDGQ